MRRGLTMVEILAAVALLGALMIAVTSWLQLASRTSAEVTPDLRWRAAADAVLRQVHDDLMTGDFDATPDASHVETRGGRLVITTRHRAPGGRVGPVAHEYMFESVRGEIRLRAAAPGAEVVEHVLLDQVGAWEAEIDRERGVLTVAISSRNGRSLVRRFDIS